MGAAAPDTHLFGHHEVYPLFDTRLPKHADPTVLRNSLAAMVDGSDPLVAAVPLRKLIRNHLGYFTDNMPTGSPTAT